jgi:hypothetical protein
MKKKESGETEKIMEIGENRLRTMCDGLSPKKRLVVVISSLIVFAVMAVYMAVSSIYFSQRPELEIEHIERLKLPRSENEKFNPLFFDSHDNDE